MSTERDGPKASISLNIYDRLENTKQPNLDLSFYIIPGRRSGLLFVFIFIFLVAGHTATLGQQLLQITPLTESCFIHGVMIAKRHDLGKAQAGCLMVPALRWRWRNTSKWEEKGDRPRKIVTRDWPVESSKPLPRVLFFFIFHMVLCLLVSVWKTSKRKKPKNKTDVRR